MSKATMNRSGRYIYAIVSGKISSRNLPKGIKGQSLSAVTVGAVTALVSDVANKKIRPERRNLAAHQNVLKELVSAGTVLPMRFGVIADGDRAVEKLLREHGERFARQLVHLEGKVEMGLRVSLDVPNIFEFFVNNHTELRSERDRFIKGNQEPSHEDKIALGRLFDRILTETREILTMRIEEALAPHLVEVLRNAYRSEREIMNLACLVERKALQEFESALFEAANLFDNNYTFDYNGPWAPHNFVEMEF